jgi:hypothetical protein
MESEGSSSSSEEHATGLYPEPDESNPNLTTPISLRSILPVYV